MGHRHGFPLWFPDPDSNLPPSYQATGTRVGDLGYITDDGAFAYLFNVYAPADDPINVGRVPPTSNLCQGFLLLIYSFVHSKNCTRSTMRVGFEFSCSSARAAILFLPDGAVRYNCNFPARLYEHAKTNAQSWYQYFNGEQGREIRNGSLYLVTGCDKCHSWGTACFHYPSDHHSVSLRFLIAGLGEVAGLISHRWEVQTGIHRRNHQCDATSNLANQTIFIRGFTISVREQPQLLRRMFGMKSAVEIYKSDGSNVKGPRIFSSIPYGIESTSESSNYSTSAMDMYRTSAGVMLHHAPFSTCADSYCSW
ncbi:uncharacterized protein EV420DRAFT_1276391 [Desarmillaria tabescens]|uniref:Uncharacterized protein n=1 Tax=Armillaria tabescens TaxID=1929756 RepID=A0AA39JQE3_ARMTA|nr:uncharacterized protein EV420DRAFT_1276391 [Desarmillaria tabescens]KAK0447007.1 hypothetical protein EV420DRAFT_1276391 [Desarmillaria tabescens]